MKPLGEIIILSGPSCSGKTSIANALIPLLDKPFLHADADFLKEMCPPPFPPERGSEFDRPSFVPALYASIPAIYRALALYGNNIIVTDVIRPLQAKIYAEQLRGLDAACVSVTCEVDELESRERARGNRRLGNASQQSSLLTLLNIYDLQVDTTNNTPEASAAEILAYHRSHAPATALFRIDATEPTAWRDLTDEMDRVVYDTYLSRQ